MRRAWLVAVVLAGCGFHASYDGTAYQCGIGETCPTGQHCVAGACVLGDAPDAPAGTADAATDAPIGAVDASVSPDAMPAARCGTLALFSDNFSTDRAGVWWDGWSEGGPIAKVTNGYLSISIAATGANHGAGYAGRYFYDFHDSQAQATITKVSDRDTILEVRDPALTKLQLVASSGQLSAGVFGNTGSPGYRMQIPYDPAVHKHWRIRESGGTAYWEWSTDGAAWTELWHEADPLQADHVTIVLAAYGTGASEARFSEVNIAAPSPALGLCAASSLTDDFLGASFGSMWNTWFDAGATVTVAGGKAVITTDGTANIYGGFETRDLYDLRGDSYYLDAVTIPRASPYVAWVDAMAPSGGQNLLEFTVEGTTLTMLQKVAGTVQDTKSITYDPSAHRFWRFRGAGTMVYWDTSPDAATWTQAYAATSRFDLGAIQFVHAGGEYDVTGAHTEAFGSVNLP
jgi:hypothetical protein